jgi:hypothetical protein
MDQHGAQLGGTMKEIQTLYFEDHLCGTCSTNGGDREFVPNSSHET